MIKKMGCGQAVGCFFRLIAGIIGTILFLVTPIYTFILSSGGFEAISKTLDGTLPMDPAKWLGHFAIFWGVLASEILVAVLIIVAIKSKKARSKEIVFYMLVLAATIVSVALGYISVTSAAAKNSYAELLIANTAVRYFVLFGVLLLFLREKFLDKKPAANIYQDDKLIEEFLTRLEEDAKLRQKFWMALNGERQK